MSTATSDPASTRGTIRVMIVEDERLSREALSGYLADMDRFELVGAYATGADALRAMADDRPDLLLLDIEMPGLDGFEVLGGLPDRDRPEVVFITAHDRYAVSAFDIGAVDYVLKPFDDQRVHRAMMRAARAIETRRGNGAGEGAAANGRWVTRLLIQQTGRTAFFVPVEEISHFEAEQNYVRVHHSGGAQLVRSALTDLEKRLDPGMFRRVHRSYVVNIDEVQEIEPRGVSDYSVVLRGGTRVPVGRMYRDRVLSDA